MFYNLKEEETKPKKRRLKTWILYFSMLLLIFSIIILLHYFNIIHVYNNIIVFDNKEVEKILITIALYELFKKLDNAIGKRQ